MERKERSRRAALGAGLGLAVLFAAGSPAARAALPVYVEFFDASGSAIAGPVTVKGFERTTEGLSFLHRVSRAVNPQGGGVSKQIQLALLDLTYPVGPASPFLAAALVRGGDLSKTVFHFVRPDASGKPLEFFRVTLDDVAIHSLAMRLPDVNDPANHARPLEETIVLSYDQGTFDWLRDVQQLFYLPADVNADLRFDISDPIRLLGYLFADELVRCPLAGDMNQDRSVDISDSIAMLLSLFNDGPPPPQPFPACGLPPPDAAIPCHESACQ